MENEAADVKSNIVEYAKYLQIIIETVDNAPLIGRRHIIYRDNLHRGDKMKLVLSEKQTDIELDTFNFADGKPGFHLDAW